MVNPIWYETIKEWAESNYDKGYGYQVIVECFDDAEYERVFGHCHSTSDAMRIAKELVEIWNDQYLDVTNA